jgi:hypothetical protein
LKPSEQNKQRAREILNRYYDFPAQRLEYKSCLDELTTVLSAKDEEIERLRDENYTDLLDQMDEAWGRGFAMVGGSEIRAFIESRRVHKPTATARATARADAIRECARLAQSMAAGETYETGRQKAINIAAALKSLLNEKGEKDG